MAASLLDGAAVGAVASELLKLIIEETKKAVQFRQHLERLKSTLADVKPVVERGKALGDQLTDRPRPNVVKLVEQLNKGKKFVTECETIPKWNYIKKYKYSKRFIKLDESLRSFFQLDAQADIWCITQEIMVELKELTHRVGGLSLGERNGGGGFNNSNLCAVPGLPSLTVGLDVPLKELKIELFEEGVTVVVLSAPGGCGKTTLASRLCHDQEVRGLFKENVFFLTISSTPDLKTIVQRLYEQVTGGSPIKFQNEEDAIKQLEDKMKNKLDDMLVILDDVWSESVVDKFLFRTERYKLLVTSRMRFPSKPTHDMKMLSHEDAKKLFCHEAFSQIENQECEMIDSELVDKIVKGCKGYPLVLKVIASSLKQKKTIIWHNMERKLSNSCFNFDMNKEILNRLATSLDFEDDTVRECFLDFGSFPEDQRIPVSVLIDMWTELYELDGDDAYVNLLELHTRNLLNLVGTTGQDVSELFGYFNKQYVVQHDLLRDLAIYQGKEQKKDIKKSKRLLMERREDALPKSWHVETDESFSARLVSILTGEKFSSRWCHMQLPEAEVLILDFLETNYSLPSFMENMGKMKVLIITNNGLRHAKLCNLEALHHLSQLKRIRLEKISVPSLSDIAVSLKNLQKISLVMCKVGQALRKCSIKIPIMLPNLTELEIDYCDDLVELPLGICDAVHLEKISITNCHSLSTLPEEIGRMKELKVLRLHACTELMELPQSIGGLQKLVFLDISDCVSLKRLPREMGELKELRKLDMRRCPVKELPRLASGLQNLDTVICDEETAFLWEPLQPHLSKLKIKKINDEKSLDWLGNLK
ncbi:PREDICTED: putative disease resistance protein At5g47280 [Nelumbo nucifera]|uniref:RPW8 domain-containing protein n=2 Tax=Nelumbo nucifera TaxID=4432 RepID=A0A822YJ30_NELNU|nr:PREDICTED: putative disease resistance protein At5g47280 [Nelumbo nucifera]DAD32590.1 TPA_asm: hypothetical protein HUJ06_011441 [Nelumbo nucifera]